MARSRKQNTRSGSTCGSGMAREFGVPVAALVWFLSGDTWERELNSAEISELQNGRNSPAIHAVPQ